MGMQAIFSNHICNKDQSIIQIPGANRAQLPKFFSSSISNAIYLDKPIAIRISHNHLQARSSAPLSFPERMSHPQLLKQKATHTVPSPS